MEAIPPIGGHDYGLHWQKDVNVWPEEMLGWLMVGDRGSPKNERTTPKRQGTECRKL